MHASLGDGPDRLRAPRRRPRVTVGQDRRRLITPAQAHPASPHRPALGPAPQCAGRGSASGRQWTRRLALAAALR